MSIIFKDPQDYNITTVKQNVKPKILCVDIGTKKHGIAISSQNMIFAHPMQNVYTFEKIYEIFANNNCHTLVVGYPFILEADNNELLSPELKICKVIDLFVSQFLLQFKNCTVFYFNENFSSSSLEGNILNKKQLDSAVASSLLSQFINHYVL